eukprot:1981569-Prymnesium_polylepis.1
MVSHATSRQAGRVQALLIRSWPRQALAYCGAPMFAFRTSLAIIGSTVLDSRARTPIVQRTAATARRSTRPKGEREVGGEKEKFGRGRTHTTRIPTRAQ